MKLKNLIPKLIRKHIKIGIARTRKASRIVSYWVRKPSNYKNIVHSYDKYLYYQNTKYSSFESNNHKWKEGQERYLNEVFSSMDRDLNILDIACGDGVGLRHMRKMGFKRITGVELNLSKASIAKEDGISIINSDMHDLAIISDNEFDIVYSSHTLEHAYKPNIVVSEFTRILKKNGLLYIVLPYPDQNIHNDEAHGGKYELGTNILDNGETVINFFLERGLSLIEKKFDSFREPEIWLIFKNEND